MPNNTGFMLLAGLGALLFLGRGGAVKKPDEDNRFVAGLGGAAPMGRPAFDIQGYVDGLFRDTATVPVQPPMRFFYPAPVVVSSSGVPGVTVTAPDIITPTTKVQIGGEGGETITASAQAVLRTELIKQQNFEHAANVQPKSWAATAAANRIEEARQMKFAADLIAKNITAQQAARAKTREEQERAIRTVSAVPPTINYDASDEEGLSFGSTAGQDIVISDTMEDIDVDFTPVYSETFVISGGMDSPMVYAGEEEDYQPTTTHQLTASYDIGF